MTRCANRTAIAMTTAPASNHIRSRASTESEGGDDAARLAVEIRDLQDELAETAERAVTEAPAQAWRLTDYGLKVGARADLQLLPAPSWEEALRLQPPPEKVWFKGRLVAENSLHSELYRGS